MIHKHPCHLIRAVLRDSLVKRPITSWTPETLLLIKYDSLSPQIGSGQSAPYLVLLSRLHDVISICLVSILDFVIPRLHRDSFLPILISAHNFIAFLQFQSRYNFSPINTWHITCGTVFLLQTLFYYSVFRFIALLSIPFRGNSDAAKLFSACWSYVVLR